MTVISYFESFIQSICIKCRHCFHYNFFSAQGAKRFFISSEGALTERSAIIDGE